MSQECIPVRYVPPALYCTRGSVWWVSVRGVSLEGGLCPGGSLCQGDTPRRNMGPGSQTGSDIIIQRPPPPVNRMTDTSKNITLPQTTVNALLGTFVLSQPIHLPSESGNYERKRTLKTPTNIINNFRFCSKLALYRVWGTWAEHWVL